MVQMCKTLNRTFRHAGHVDHELQKCQPIDESMKSHPPLYPYSMHVGQLTKSFRFLILVFIILVLYINEKYMEKGV